MTDFAREWNYTEVPDPYYGGEEGFELVLDLLEDSCAGFWKNWNSLNYSRISNLNGNNSCLFFKPIRKICNIQLFLTLTKKVILSLASFTLRSKPVDIS